MANSVSQDSQSRAPRAYWRLRSCTTSEPGRCPPSGASDSGSSSIRDAARRELERREKIPAYGVSWSCRNPYRTLLAQYPTQKVCSAAGFHADQLDLQVRGEVQQLLARELLAHHDPAAGSAQPDDWKPVFATAVVWDERTLTCDCWPSAYCHRIVVAVVVSLGYVPSPLTQPPQQFATPDTCAGAYQLEMGAMRLAAKHGHWSPPEENTRRRATI
jgi:hypothetical protein